VRQLVIKVLNIIDARFNHEVYRTLSPWMLSGLDVCSLRWFKNWVHIAPWQMASY